MFCPSVQLAAFSSLFFDCYAQQRVHRLLLSRECCKACVAHCGALTLDSEAAFKERALKVGLMAANHAILEREGYNTFGSLAFAVSASPKQCERGRGERLDPGGFHACS